MKRLFLLAVAALFAASVSAQDMGGWVLGPKMGIYTNTGDTVIGVGASARYRLDSNWRIEPSAMALLHKGCSVDISCDAHYVFDMGVVRLYPAAGITANDIGKFAVGLDLGGGVDFNIADVCELNAGLTWKPMFNKYRPNPVVVSIGAMFRF